LKIALVSESKLKICKPYLLEAIALGEKLDPERHHPRVDVKAVTLHHFRLEKTERGWKALVILDI
jgi:SHS2 domain-containing protein